MTWLLRLCTSPAVRIRVLPSIIFIYKWKEETSSTIFCPRASEHRASSNERTFTWIEKIPNSQFFIENNTVWSILEKNKLLFSLNCSNFAYFWFNLYLKVLTSCSSSTMFEQEHARILKIELRAPFFALEQASIELRAMNDLLHILKKYQIHNFL